MASHMSWEDARDRLKKFRDDQSRNSDEVVELWEHVLSDFSYKLGDEVWMVYEQVCLAACDCGRPDIVQHCIKNLQGQFPASLRVKRLKALYHEMQENFEGAEKIYNNILEEEETSSVARKRLIAIYKAQNDYDKAIRHLNKYLEMCMSDHEAWMELCDLYIKVQEYDKAAFCLEELIMSNPHNHLYHQKYAEIRYTQGGIENMEHARRYFAQALKLNPVNMRALFGLYLSASSVSTSQKKDAREKENNRRYAAWAAEQINMVYKSKTHGGGDTSASDVISSMLESFHISKPTS